tara:strand:+ start:1258 stop:1476 length:219 start_codon:yes stop_codon:yes gene_type:complete
MDVPIPTMTTPGDILRAGRGWKLGLSGGTFRARRWHSFFRISSGGFFFEEKVEKKRAKKYNSYNNVQTKKTL